MGLTSWKGSPAGKIHSSDVTIAKNYLSEDEITHLNQLVSGFLDAAELRVRNHQLTTMTECAELCNQYILFTGGQALEGLGSISKAQADEKALDEFRKFNETQLSDFDKFIQGILDTE
ncbi:DNA-binding protein [Bifidobacterium lemurum]|uniref:DNA-binding protein n=1 Tax=Bifidobacterium lemurum TaxID=1603886 RepID=A0A261FUF8_9BIFI|nr:DNA-binding protein [Bifidobacterium lemurum]